jgi:hypothetical protein
MPSSIIDGTIESVKLKRKAGKVSVFDTIVVRRTDGTKAELKGAQAIEPVAAALQAGARGRLYTFKLLDVNGIHGLRLENGQALYGFPANNENIMLLIALVNLALIVVYFAFDSGLPIFLSAPLFLLGAVGYWLYRSNRSSAKAQFEADAAWKAAAA